MFTFKAKTNRKKSTVPSSLSQRRNKRLVKYDDESDDAETSAIPSHGKGASNEKDPERHNLSSASDDERKEHKRKRRQERKGTEKKKKMKGRESTRDKKRSVSSSYKRNVNVGTVSFQFHDEDDEEQDGGISPIRTQSFGEGRRNKKDKKKHKNKKIGKSKASIGGLGFGGGALPSYSDEEEEGEFSSKIDNSEMKGFGADADNARDVTKSKDTFPDDEGQDGSTHSLYGKDALAKLKSEQRVYVTAIDNNLSDDKKIDSEHQVHASEKTEPGKDRMKSSSDTSSIDEEQQSSLSQQQVIPNTNQMEDNIVNDDAIDFIPLGPVVSQQKDNSIEPVPVIITGDEALAYVEDEGNDHENITASDSNREKVKDSNKDRLFQNSLLGTDTGSSFGVEDVSQLDEKDTEMDEGGRLWEDEVARRAGIVTDDGNNVPKLQQDDSTIVEKAEVEKNVTSNIKSIIQSTLDNLHQVNLDLESNLMRRKNEFQTMEEDYKKQELDLTSTGNAFENYQNLRSELANWVGAFREISKKIEQIEIALRKLQVDVCSKRCMRWKEWEDDVVSTLSTEGMLEEVVGRVPEFQMDTPVMVDEFGRDIRSKEFLARGKKREQRIRARRESRNRRQDRARVQKKKMNEKDIVADKNMDTNSINDNNIIRYAQAEFEDSDLDVSDNELLERAERRLALSDAVQVVLNEMDEEYTRSSKLINVFHEWAKSYPNDYKQCFADLSLAGLLSMIIRVDFCNKLDLLCMIKYGDNEQSDLGVVKEHCCFQELKVIDQTLDTSDKNSNEALLDILIQKTYLPVFMLVLPCSSSYTGEHVGWNYDVSSERQSYSIGLFFSIFMDNLPQNDLESREKLGTAVIDYFSHFIKGLTVPIVKKEAVNIIFGGNSCNEDILDAIMFSTFGQLFRFKKIVLNIVKYWLPKLNYYQSGRVAQLILLDVVAYRILPILTKLQQYDSTEEVHDGSKNLRDAIALQAKTNFKQIMEAIKKAGWMDRDDLMLYTAPLRASEKHIEELS